MIVNIQKVLLISPGNPRNTLFQVEVILNIGNTILFHSD